MLTLKNAEASAKGELVGPEEHDEILAAGDHQAALAVTHAVLRRLGWSETEIEDYFTPYQP